MKHSARITSRNSVLGVAFIIQLMITQEAPAQEPELIDQSDCVEQPRMIIQQKSFTLRDESREKDLPVRVVYPDQFVGLGQVPTIIFSHGAGGSGEMYDPLAFEWATYGYIVILPTHSDSFSLKKNDVEKPSSRQRKFGDRQRGKRINGLFDFSDWANRPRDVSFIMDRISEIEARVPEIKDRVDRDRIGVGGHSFGAFTAQLIGGTDPLGRETFEDDRAKCILLISPQGVGGLLTTDSWESFVGPGFTISGDNDQGHQGQDAVPYRRDPFDFSPPDTHVLMWIDEAYHNFGGITGRDIQLPGLGPRNSEHVMLVRKVSLAFWEHHLRGKSTDTDAFADQLRAHLKNDPVSIENN